MLDEHRLQKAITQLQIELEAGNGTVTCTCANIGSWKLICNAYHSDAYAKAHRMTVVPKVGFGAVATPDDDELRAMAEFVKQTCKQYDYTTKKAYFYTGSNGPTYYLQPMWDEFRMEGQG